MLVATVHATPVAWVNGGFELGGAAWNAYEGTSFADADGDGDVEAVLDACVGQPGLSRGISKGVVPATTPLAFNIESGGLVYSIGMILLDATGPEPYINNFDPLAPEWFDDQVLYWNEWTPQTGAAVLDPVEADQGVNIAGWADMDADERRARLSTMTHMTMVMYTCAEGATVDDFAWVV